MQAIDRAKCTLIYSFQGVSDTLATITLNSTLDGQPASPEEMVTYTCTLTEAADISWTASPVFTNVNFVQFTPTTPSNQRMLSCSDVQDINCTDINFQAALTSVGPIDVNGLADLTSTFRFPATIALNGTVIQCSGLTATTTEMVNQILIVEGM